MAALAKSVDSIATGRELAVSGMTTDAGRLSSISLESALQVPFTGAVTIGRYKGSATHE